uniref:Phospholipid/glycerol acyltransferase domain-containing protein n=1 Tax=Rhizochromulina marina TaxID=1034831 RepID=A0A7S2SU51_9STRA
MTPCRPRPGPEGTAGPLLASPGRGLEGAMSLLVVLGYVVAVLLFLCFGVAPVFVWAEERRQFDDMSLFRTIVVVQVWILLTSIEAARLGALRTFFGVDVRLEAHTSCRTIALFILRTFFDGYEVLGEEHLSAARGRPVVVVANHQSMMDVAAIFTLHLKAAWVAKTTVFWIPGVGWLMALAGYVPVSRRDKASIKQMYSTCTTRIEEDWSLILFPQGTRNRRKILPFKDGAYNLASDLGVPILPVTICIPSDIWKNGTKIVSTAHPLVMDTRDKAKVKADTFRVILTPLAKANGDDMARPGVLLAKKKADYKGGGSEPEEPSRVGGGR